MPFDRASQHHGFGPGYTPSWVDFIDHTAPPESHVSGDGENTIDQQSELLDEILLARLKSDHNPINQARIRADRTQAWVRDVQRSREMELNGARRYSMRRPVLRPFRHAEFFESPDPKSLPRPSFARLMAAPSQNQQQRPPIPFTNPHLVGVTPFNRAACFQSPDPKSLPRPRFPGSPKSAPRRDHQQKPSITTTNVSSYKVVYIRACTDDDRSSYLVDDEYSIDSKIDENGDDCGDLEEPRDSEDSSSDNHIPRESEASRRDGDSNNGDDSNDDDNAEDSDSDIDISAMKGMTLPQIMAEFLNTLDDIHENGDGVVANLKEQEAEFENKKELAAVTPENIASNYRETSIPDQQPNTALGTGQSRQLAEVLNSLNEVVDRVVNAKIGLDEMMRQLAQDISQYM